MNKPDNNVDFDTVALAEDLRDVISRFVRAVRNGTDMARTAQSEALALLDRDGAMNITTLAQLRNVKHQTMRLVIAQLEAATFVKRASDPADGRSQLFSLTQAGHAELALGRKKRSTTIDEMIRETLSHQEREVLRESIALLERMIASVGT